jgi:signal transduction histidine kinase
MDEHEQLKLETEILRKRIAEQQKEIEAVNLELTETNHGVVALYAELDDRVEALRQATDLKSRFLSYMSHEFRTPLGSITSLSRILLDRMDGPLTDEQEKQVQFIRGSAEELIEMVNDLLDLAKVEAGRITISPAWFEMLDLFSALRGMFKPIVATQTVDLVFEEPNFVLKLYTDDKKLAQILRNFISNALKFTPKGTVTVTADYHAPDSVTFAVSDTGIGIASHHQKGLFNDFVQIDSLLQKRLRGTGLGLSLSRKLAELLGGSVAVASELGKGSVFSVTIPIHLPDSVPQEPVPEPSPDRSAGKEPEHG